MQRAIDQRALAPSRKDPGDLVQMLPGRSVNARWVGHAVAILVGAAAAILLLALEGAW